MSCMMCLYTVRTIVVLLERQAHRPEVLTGQQQQQDRAVLLRSAWRHCQPNNCMYSSFVAHCAPLSRYSTISQVHTHTHVARRHRLEKQLS
jgi:hypothetical protein